MTIYFSQPDCKCDPLGSTNKSCDKNGRCPCNIFVYGTYCDECADRYWDFPSCKGEK